MIENGSLRAQQSSHEGEIPYCTSGKTVEKQSLLDGLAFRLYLVALFIL